MSIKVRGPGSGYAQVHISDKGGKKKKRRIRHVSCLNRFGIILIQNIQSSPGRKGGNEGREEWGRQEKGTKRREVNGEYRESLDFLPFLAEKKKGGKHIARTTGLQEGHKWTDASIQLTQPEKERRVGTTEKHWVIRKGHSKEEKRERRV